MFEQPSSTTNTSSSTGSDGSNTNHYFDLESGTPAHHTSVIVPPRQPHQPQHHHLQNDNTPLTPCAPYYASNGYGFPLFLGTDFLQFPHSELTSPLTPSISSPLTPHSFGPFPSIPTNQLYNRSAFPDFYAAASSSPMVHYHAAKKSSAGRKPKEEDNMEDEDDDKKLKRRQRNKEAAARCRQRRLDLMKELQDQVNGFKHLNDKKNAECQDIRSKLASLKNYLETHDCKLSHDERIRQMNLMSIPAPSQHIHQPLRIHPPRADSVPYSIKSSHSSDESEQNSPTEDYKPTIDQLMLPPIASIQTSKDRSINLMPPPALPASTSGMQIITSIPVSSSNSGSISISRSENVFAEPELKIPKIEMDRTLASLASPDDLERPSMLPMLSRNPVNQPITTPGRIFRPNGEYHYSASQSGNQNNSLFIGGDQPSDFLATNTGLTPSGQPTMNFVSTPTPIHPLPESELRPL